jgi:hypothetical protein
LPDETPDALHSLTLSELRETLNRGGVKIGLSTLSEMITDGDVAEQLGAERRGNRLLFPPDAVTVLAAFIPHFREDAKVTNAGRPESLRAFLHTQGKGQNALVPAAGTSLSDIRETADIGQQIVTAMQHVGLIPAPSDRLLTIKQAMSEYGISEGTLHKMSVKEGGKRKVKESKIRAYLRDL